MSRVLTIGGEQVQFVLSDSEDLNTEALSDIIYSDGTRAILVNSTGQILQSDTQTVVLQDGDYQQYYINDENAEILVTKDEDIITQPFEATEVQLIEEDSNVACEPQIIYVNEEGYAINDSDLSQYQIAETDNSENILSVEGIKLETQVVDLEELMRQQGVTETDIIQDSSSIDGYQYAILKDGKLHIQSYNGDIFPLTTTQVEPEQVEEIQEPTTQHDLDLSRITGKNLLTGQTVTLHGYMDKLQQKLKDSKVKSVEKRKRKTTSSAGLKSLLNKKLTLGKTSNGKRLVGKIIHVEKKASAKPAVREDFKDEESDDLCANEMGDENLLDGSDVLGFSNADLVPLSDLNLAAETATNPPAKPLLSATRKKVLIQEKMVTKDSFEHMSRTLSGLMNMDSVRKKLQYKNILVKVVERHFDEAKGSYVRKASYCSGHMREEFVVNDEGEVLENWTFASDSDVNMSIFGESKDDAEGDDQSKPYPESTNVTLIITMEKNGHRAIRVILNPPGGSFQCSACSREFGSKVQLRVHTINSHGQTGFGACEVCGLGFDDEGSLLEHRLMHVEEGKLFRCPEKGCGKFFLTARRLQRHASVHDATLKPLECSVCLQRCSSESGLKKHLMTHMHMKIFKCNQCNRKFTNPGDLNVHKKIHDPLNYYACEICKRTFSRHSNLQRHVEIHRGSEKLYQCSICGCSYHYMSSLTRHVVQNHIQRSDLDPEQPLELVEEDVEEEEEDS